MASAEIFSPDRICGSTRAFIPSDPRWKIGGAPIVWEKSPAATPPQPARPISCMAMMRMKRSPSVPP